MSFVSKAILWDRGLCHHTVSAQTLVELDSNKDIDNYIAL